VGVTAGTRGLPGRKPVPRDNDDDDEEEEEDGDDDDNFHSRFGSDFTMSISY
jgi:hypothetical protein